MPILPRKIQRALSVLLLVTLAAGCSSLGGIVDPPKVSLANVQLLQAGLLEQRYRLTLRVQNPNSIAVPIKGIDYAITLAGVDFASGVTPNAFSVPARGEDLVGIDISTNLLESARQIYSVIRQGPESLDYSVTGNIAVDMPFVNPIPFSKSGQVSLTGIAAQ
ncbi:MAG: LEA type 2 family protein [Gammaproteobacteria bacterium]|nr:LEA type 2 family protein [Gammaproteobacteria bacterium]